MMSVFACNRKFSDLVAPIMSKTRFDAKLELRWAVPITVILHMFILKLAQLQLYTR